MNGLSGRIVDKYPGNPSEVNELCLLVCAINSFSDKAKKDALEVFPSQTILLKKALDLLKEKGVLDERDTLLFPTRTPESDFKDYEIKGNKTRIVYLHINEDVWKFFRDYLAPMRYLNWKKEWTE